MLPLSSIAIPGPPFHGKSHSPQIGTGGDSTAESPLSPCLLLPYPSESAEMARRRLGNLSAFPFSIHFALNVLSLTKSTGIIGNPKNSRFPYVFNHLPKKILLRPLTPSPEGTNRNTKSTRKSE
jgi:hypothetical protein